MPDGTDNPIWIVALLRLLKAVSSSSEAKRLIEAGAVLINEQPVKEFNAEVNWRSGMIIKVGKHRIYKLKE